MYDLMIKNGKVWIDGKFKKTNVYVENGIFAKISEEVFNANTVIDGSGQWVLPGFIDPHVHFALDCRTTKSADDFYSGSVAAAFGGVTTFIDFLDPTDNAYDLEKAYHKRVREAKNAVVDYKFHACIKDPKGNLESYVLKMLKLGMTSVKCFTTYSESGRRTYDQDIKELLRLSEKYHFLVLIHIENDEMIRHNPEDKYRDLSIVRPSIAETAEALKLAGFVRECGGMLYMVHCSSGNTIKALKEQYPDLLNQKLFVESCPQYFLFRDVELQSPNGFLYTMAPPLRSVRERDLLRTYFKDIACIGTDHCPFMRTEKNKSYLSEIPLGMGGVEHAFCALYPLFKKELIEKMTANTARIHGISDRKGSIAVEKDADFVLVCQNTKSIITTTHTQSDYDLYLGLRSFGTINYTFVRGRAVVHKGEFVPQTGQLI